MVKFALKLRFKFITIIHNLICKRVKMEDINKQVDFLARNCQKLGLKLTNQRIEIYKELLKASDHPSAETLHRRLLDKIPALSVDTVYRTLATFCEYGLALKLPTAESQAHFEIQHTPHHHVICNSCRNITNLYNVMQDETLSRKLAEWGQMITQHVVVYGVCQDCLLANKHESQNS